MRLAFLPGQWASLAAFPAALLGLACSAGNPVDDGDFSGGDGDISVGDGDISVGDGDGDIGSPRPQPVPTTDPRAQNGIAVREQVCDANNVCTCLRLALLGTLTSEADDTDTSAFVAWLNGNTDGTATVTMVTDQPALDEGWLAQYDVLVIANVNGWTFSESEKAAVAAWSAKGGGILAITGFESTVTEAASSSALISFAGMGFMGTTQSEWTAPPEGQSVPVYYNGGTVDMRNCLRWTGSDQAGNTTPIRFAPQSGELEALTFELDTVGAYIGWSVLAPAGATIFAQDPATQKNMAAAIEYNGAGRIVTFGDEWVIFANQWEPSGEPHNRQMDNYNPCWIPPEETQAATGAFHSVATIYQTKQLWYNAISWVAPPNECGFVVVDDDVTIR